MNKKQNQQYHFACRIKERYGITNSLQFYSAIKNIIINDNKHEIYKQTNRVSIHVIPIKLKDKVIKIPFVYDKHRKTVVTALPQDWFDNKIINDDEFVDE